MRGNEFENAATNYYRFAENPCAATDFRLSQLLPALLLTATSCY